MICLLQNADIWHTLLSKICAKSRDLSKNRLDDLAGFAPENPGYKKRIFGRSLFYAKMHIFVHKKRIFYEKKTI